MFLISNNCYSFIHCINSSQPFLVKVVHNRIHYLAPESLNQPTLFQQMDAKVSFPDQIIHKNNLHSLLIDVPLSLIHDNQRAESILELHSIWNLINLHSALLLSEEQSRCHATQMTAFLFSWTDHPPPSDINNPVERKLKLCFPQHLLAFMIKNNHSTCASSNITYNWLITRVLSDILYLPILDDITQTDEPGFVICHID